jgi:hypothetical protein
VDQWIIALDAGVEETSARSGFRLALRKARGLPVDETGSDLAVAAASNDLSGVGRLLGARDVDAVWFDGRKLPGSLVRRPLKCSLLDVAVGSGSVEMTKYLMEFHSAGSTREMLKMAISTGNLELIKMMLERLPEVRDRLDLMEVASEFHQEEVLTWLLRDASVFDDELLWVFALEKRLANALLAALETGHRPWLWWRAREVVQQWRASAEFDLVAAPDGFSTEGGWWASKSAEESPLAPLGPGGVGVWTLPNAVRKEDLVFAALPAGVTTIGDAAFDGCSNLARLDLPSSVSEIGAWAFHECSGLTVLGIPLRVRTCEEYIFSGCSGLMQLEIPPGVRMIGNSAFSGCSGLVELEIPSSVRTIGAHAFGGCSGLTELRIPSSVTTIGRWAFSGCAGVRVLHIPSSVTTMGDTAFHGCSGLRELQLRSHFIIFGTGVFWGVTDLARLTLVGSVLSRAVVVSLECCLAPSAKVIGPAALLGRRFGHVVIVHA